MFDSATQVVDLIPKVYSAPRIIRVIHEDGSNESVPINQEFVPNDPNSKVAQQGQQEQAEGLVKLFDLTTGKYDVTCEVGPSYATKREEAASQMMELGRAYPPLMQIAGDLLAKNLDWPGADDIAERLKAMLPPQIQGKNPQAAQMQQQMQMMDSQAKQAIGQLTQQLQQLQQKLAAEQNSQQSRCCALKSTRRSSK